jgi:hypothetical protein
MCCSFNQEMLTSLIITAIITGALAYALRPGKHGDPIVHRPYNNRYDAAAAARDFGLFE